MEEGGKEVCLNTSARAWSVSLIQHANLIFYTDKLYHKKSETPNAGPGSSSSAD